MRLLAGLGNPGTKYQGTRHNIGFTALDRLARRHGIALSQQRFSSVMGSGRVAGAKVLLIQPQTYMNLSGQAVRRVFDYFKLSLDDLLVLHDDMDVELGRIKIVVRGGPGGHKGVASIIEALGTDEFARIKIGVGRPGAGQKSEDYVLSQFSPGEEDVMRRIVEKVVEAAEIFFSEGGAEVQARFNRKNLRVKEEVEV